MKQKHVLWMKEIHQRRKKQWFCEMTFSQGSPIGKQNDMFFSPLFSCSNAHGGLGRRRNTSWERGGIMTRTTTAKTIKRDTCEEVGKKGRKKNNIGDEEKETQEKEKKQEEGEKKTRRHTTQKRRMTTGRKKLNWRKRKGMMKENQKQRHQQKKNKHNQQEHRKIDQNHDQKLKYLLHKKSSIIKMIERDLLSRRKKARNIKQLSLSSWRCMRKEGECSDRYIRTVSLPWPR